MTDKEQIAMLREALEGIFNAMNAEGAASSGHGYHPATMAHKLGLQKAYRKAEEALAATAPSAQGQEKVDEQNVSFDQAREALDSLDDYARMDAGVDAYGPRGILERFIEQQARAALRSE